MIRDDAWGMVCEQPLSFFAAGTLGFGVNYFSLGVTKHAAGPRTLTCPVHKTSPLSLHLNLSRRCVSL